MDIAKTTSPRTRIEGFVILLVAGGYLWETFNIPDFYQLPDTPGPTTFPELLGIVFAAMGLWLLLSPGDIIARLRARRDGTSPAATAPAAPGENLFARLGLDWHFVALWIVVLGYLWFMPDLGFPVATFILLVLFTALLGETRWHIVLSLALAVTIVVYVSFKYGLNVRLPLGILEFLRF
ncbi:MAG: tripartite tricarboxylate transporter TctB family protein [Rhodoplanes sp.]|uniref:tripartite tricarboxylate transporter TctB family protein n=1 Tax=Rhodoplanes sp. TaxID=1968906 RepID=UPI0017E23372|nr:tripartite tricarboxylate transporter TctB family protein [Rhodoplanes sp.]NVO15693.1 tripartite tricarboxylate transporter TctB family protein [Rhodoplanes sp.]